MIARFALTLAAVLLVGLSYLSWQTIWAERPSEFAGSEWFPWTAKDVACVNSSQCSGVDYIAIARHAPLSAVPFEAALRRELNRDETVALQVAEQLFARDPRSVDARVVLADRSLVAGDMQAFGKYYFPLFNIMRHDQRRFAEPLVTLSSSREVFSEVQERLRAAPPWGQEYLLASLGTESPAFADLAPLFEHYPHLRGHLFARMMQSNQTRNAYSFFVSSLTATEFEHLGVPFNPNFILSEAPRPFNWFLVSKNAEFVESGGLFAYFQGGKNEQFFRQILPLGAGRYRLTVSFDGQRTEPAGSFEWRLTCASNNRQLASLAIDELASQTKSQFVDFEIPLEGCEFQTLAFWGVPGILAKPSQITLRGVSIDPREMNQ